MQKVSETVELHKKQAKVTIKCGVITLSDTLSRKYKEYNDNSDDLSGKYIISKLETKYDVLEYDIIPDDSLILTEKINQFIESGVNVIFTTGGTGLTKRDITIETIEKLITKELKGFGEIFRRETYDTIGSAAILTRTTAGIYNDTVIFALPGSPNAVELGLDIIFDELGHIVSHAQKRIKHI